MDVRGQLDVLHAKIREAVPELTAKVEELRDGWEAMEDRFQTEDDALKDAIADSTVSLAETQRGDTLMAVYSKPRTKWDTKGLDGYAVAHPEIGVFRSEGRPSVSIRAIKK
jgi:hypothetical protein